MGNAEPSRRPTTERSDCGHVAGAPSEEDDQSVVFIIRARLESPLRKASCGSGTIGPECTVAEAQPFAKICRSGLEADDLLALFAQPRDPQRDHVALAQEHRRL